MVTDARWGHADAFMHSDMFVKEDESRILHQLGHFPTLNVRSIPQNTRERALSFTMSHQRAAAWPAAVVASVFAAFIPYSSAFQFTVDSTTVTQCGPTVFNFTDGTPPYSITAHVGVV